MAPAPAYTSRHHSRSQLPIRSGIALKIRALTEKHTAVAIASEIASENVRADLRIHHVIPEHVPESGRRDKIRQPSEMFGQVSEPEFEQ